jgi:hypothetical protein
LITALAVLFASLPALAAQDDPVVTITGSADMAAKRASYINSFFGQSTLPTTLPTVTTGVSNPYGSTLPNVARVDQYSANMSNSQMNTSLLYIANSPNNRRVVIFNMGHRGTCTWPPYSRPLLRALLSAGYSIFAMNMPACGVLSAHVSLVGKYGALAIQYFLLPAVEAMNYWDANGSFSRYDMVGLSGGGWTTTVLAALDKRIGVSIPIAGSLPGVQLICADGVNYGDSGFGEQQQTAAIAAYVDLYLMAASDAGHRQMQILNIRDDCCFGPLQWTSCYSTAHGGVDWYNYVAAYQANIWSSAAANGIRQRYELIEDQTATKHQISNPYAINLILKVLRDATVGAHR